MGVVQERLDLPLQLPKGGSGSGGGMTSVVVPMVGSPWF